MAMRAKWLRNSFSSFLVWLHLPAEMAKIGQKTTDFPRKTDFFHEKGKKNGQTICAWGKEC